MKSLCRTLQMLGVVLGMLVLHPAGRPYAQETPQPPVFRGRVALVPIDVRVIDRQGNPVTDLTRDDFTILEDGARQTISHFEVQEYPGEPTTADLEPAVARPEPEV